MNTGLPLWIYLMPINIALIAILLRILGFFPSSRPGPNLRKAGFIRVAAKELRPLFNTAEYVLEVLNSWDIPLGVECDDDVFEFVLTRGSRQAVVVLSGYDGDFGLSVRFTIDSKTDQQVKCFHYPVPRAPVMGAHIHSFLHAREAEVEHYESRAMKVPLWNH